MRFLNYFILFLFVSVSTFAQSNFTLNTGTVQQPQYFSELPFKWVNGKIIIEVTIRTEKFFFLLDTGAPTTVSQMIKDKFSLPTINSIPVGDQSALVETMDVTIIPNLKIGSINFQNTPALVSDQKMIFDCLGIEGIIGSNQLRNSMLQINYEKKTISITNIDETITINASYARELWLNEFQSLPFIWVDLKGRKNGREQLLFDSGMNGFYDISNNNYQKFKSKRIFKTIAQGTGTNSLGLHGVAANNNHEVLYLPEMQVNQHSFKNIKVVTTHDHNSRIGSDLLRYGIVIIDFKNKKFYFEPYERVDVDLNESIFPFELGLNQEGKMSFGIIWNEKMMKGASVGDELISIDQLQFKNLSICDLIVLNSDIRQKEEVSIKFKSHKGEIEQIKVRKMR